MSWTDAFINTDTGDLSDGIQVAEMVSSNSCKIGDLVLTAEDLLFNENTHYFSCYTTHINICKAP